MKTIEIKVKNCKDCPFSSTDFKNGQMLYSNCFAPTKLNEENGVLTVWKYRIDSYWKNYKKPKWCPLTNKELKITT